MDHRTDQPRPAGPGRRGKPLTAADEVAWVAWHSGQSAADLLAVPATVYGAIKTMVVEAFIARAERAQAAAHHSTQNRLMSKLKGGG